MGYPLLLISCGSTRSYWDQAVYTPTCARENFKRKTVKPQHIILRASVWRARETLRNCSDGARAVFHPASVAPSPIMPPRLTSRLPISRNLFLEVRPRPSPFFTSIVLVYPVFVDTAHDPRPSPPRDAYAAEDVEGSHPRPG